jgi:hypothetical protein
MRNALTLLLMAALPTFAQAQAGPATVPVQKSCADCGVVRSVRLVTKEVRPTADAAKPSGLVASIPLKGSEPPRLGSSARLGKDQVSVIENWEVIVRLDDGRFRVVMLDEPTDLREGDKVRIEQGRPVRRTD